MNEAIVFNHQFGPNNTYFQSNYRGLNNRYIGGNIFDSTDKFKNHSPSLSSRTISTDNGYGSMVQQRGGTKTGNMISTEPVGGNIFRDMGHVFKDLTRPDVLIPGVIGAVGVLAPEFAPLTFAAATAAKEGLKGKRWDKKGGNVFSDIGDKLSHMSFQDHLNIITRRPKFTPKYMP